VSGGLPVRRPDHEADDVDYVKLVVLAIAGALAVYWGLVQYIRQSAMDNLVGVVVGVALIGMASGAVVRRLQRRGRPALALPDHPVVNRYRELLDELSRFDRRKRSLLEGGLLPQLQELIEEKLPELVLRRDRYRAYHDRCDERGLQAGIADLERRLAEEGDADIRRALQKNLDLARSTGENYARIAKTLKLYDLQINSIERQLENLDSKLHVLELDDDIKAAAEAIVQGINADIADLEHALVQIDALGGQGEAS
jgi:hypothetical protein